MPAGTMRLHCRLQAAPGKCADLCVQGLGKTVELLACIVANRFKGPRLPAELVSARIQHVGGNKAGNHCPIFSV